MITPQCRNVTNDSGVTTMHSENNEKATENGNTSSHDNYVNITSNGAPTVSEQTNDQNVATTPIESDKGDK